MVDSLQVILHDIDVTAFARTTSRRQRPRRRLFRLLLIRPTDWNFLALSFARDGAVPEC